MSSATSAASSSETDSGGEAEAVTELAAPSDC